MLNLPYHVSVWTQLDKPFVFPATFKDISLFDDLKEFLKEYMRTVEKHIQGKTRNDADTNFLY